MRVHKEGWPFAIGGLLAGILLAELARIFDNVVPGLLAGVAFLAAGFCAYFFRDPRRIVPRHDRGYLSPADGKVMEVVEGRDPISQEPVWIIRIFLSVFQPHLQRSPVKGTVLKIRYTEGKFLDARDPKAAFENEQNRIEIESEQAGPVVVTQIAGLIARRIVCWVQEGQRLEAGQQIGLIRFGSQVDMTLPWTADVKVKPGEYVKAGTSLIAEEK